MEAEVSRVTAKDIQCMQLYEKAIELTRSNKFPNWEGLAHELAGNYYRSRKANTAAEAHYIQALNLYKVSLFYLSIYLSLHRQFFQSLILYNLILFLSIYQLILL